MDCPDNASSGRALFSEDGRVSIFTIPVTTTGDDPVPIREVEAPGRYVSMYVCTLHGTETLVRLEHTCSTVRVSPTSPTWRKVDGRRG